MSSLLKQTLAATGHRPGKLGGYGVATEVELVMLALDYLRPMKNEIESVISGMALGFDLAWAEAAVNLNIPLIAAVPFPGQCDRWKDDGSRERYDSLLKRAHRVVHTSGGWRWDVYRIRNRWMVDNSDGVVALWDGSRGGTSNCVRYATAKGKLKCNLWSEYEQRLRGTSPDAVRPGAALHGEARP